MEIHSNTNRFLQFFCTYILLIVPYSLYMLKRQVEEKKKEAKKKKDGLQTLKTTILVSVVVVAVAGTVFAVTKKLREKWTC